MAQLIDFETKSDRELLLLTAQTCNTIVQEQLPDIKDKLDELNGTVREHSIKLAKVETKQKINYQGDNRKNRKVIVGSGISGAIALIVAVIYAVGNALGWW